MEKFTKYPELNLLIQLILKQYEIEHEMEISNLSQSEKNNIENEKQKVLDLLHDTNIRLPWISDFHEKQDFIRVDAHVAKAGYNLSKILNVIYKNKL